MMRDVLLGRGTFAGESVRTRLTFFWTLVVVSVVGWTERHEVAILMSAAVIILLVLGAMIGMATCD